MLYFNEKKNTKVTERAALMKTIEMFDANIQTFLATLPTEVSPVLTFCFQHLKNALLFPSVKLSNNPLSFSSLNPFFNHKESQKSETRKTI